MRPGFIPQRLFAAFLAILLASCSRHATNPPFADLDFTALADEGHAYLFHVDSQGKTSREPIDFLKDVTFYTWDFASLDELVTADMAGRQVDRAWNINYYKGTIL